MDADAYVAVLEYPALEAGEVEREYLVSLQQPVLETLTVGEQGPPGRPGVGGADISTAPGNALQTLPDGLYVAETAWQSKQW